MIATASKPIRKRRQTPTRRCTFKNAYTRFFTRVQYGPNLYQGYFGMELAMDPMGQLSILVDLFNKLFRRNAGMVKEYRKRLRELEKKDTPKLEGIQKNLITNKLHGCVRVLEGDEVVPHYPGDDKNEEFARWLAQQRELGKLIDLKYHIEGILTIHEYDAYLSEIMWIHFKKSSGY